MSKTLQDIADRIAPLLAKSDNENSMKIDCGADGVMVLDGTEVTLQDRPAACTISISLVNLKKLLKGELNPMTGVMKGKLKVAGNPAVAMEMARYLKG